MDSMRQSCRPKHQVLILKCYPQYQKGVQEVKPNASELSYLLYYISTRRSKLTKVCSFLEKRAARDVWSRRIGNVQVTLQILTALMEKVPRDLPLYAQYVLSVVDIVLRSQDVSMAEDSLATFETFCQHQDMASLAADLELSTQYQAVVRTYASLADIKSSSQSKGATSSPMSIRWRNAGLRAIRGVVGSDETLAADGGDSLKLILPVILGNLYTGEEDVLVLLQLRSEEDERSHPELPPRRRVSVATVQNVDAADGDPAVAGQSTADADRKAEMDVRLLALRCLEQIIVSGSTRGQIRVTVIAILRFILEKDQTTSSSQEKNKGGTSATSLMELVAKWSPVQVRFIILNAAVEVLLEITPTEQNLTRSSTMVHMIDWLLKSPVNMIGLSVMDVLLGLMQYITSVLCPKVAVWNADEKHVPYLDETSLSDQRRELLGLLVQSIGHLATHIYYGDQVTDIIRTLLSHLKPVANHDSSTSTTDYAEKLVSPPGEAHSVVFSALTAKATALKAVKNVLIVASRKKPSASAGVESRNQVGTHVWEDTQWLLRDQREVYYAYIDALLAWLRLETKEDDQKIKEAAGRPLPKRDMPDITDKNKRMTGSPPVNHRAKAVQVAQSNFLRLLHLAIYEHALDRATDESETLLLHLLLTSLVERLGVNSMRFGLPMVLKLQDETMAASNLYSSTAKVNIGSLVFGYLWALFEKFDLEVYRVGAAIYSEIDKRKKFGVWLDTIKLPPLDLDEIVPSNGQSPTHAGQENPEFLKPFGEGVYELVDRIEEAYNASVASPVQSPPSSPERGLGNSTSGNVGTGIPQKERLPPSVKHEMLSEWSKDSCLADVQKVKARTASINGSKAGTLAFGGSVYLNGFGNSSASTTSPVSAQQHGSGSLGSGAAGLPDRRRMSVPEFAGTPANSSSRGSAVRVNELRGVLSSCNDASNRRLSPLRGRLVASDDSIMSSSSESMVSGYSLSEIDGDGMLSRPQSVVEVSEGDGMETPRASTLVLSGEGSSHNIPPVPPIPSQLSVPGGFPPSTDSSQASTPNAERPFTAPAPAARKQGHVNGNSGPYRTSRPNNTLNRRKSRSNTGLATVANAEKLELEQRQQQSEGQKQHGHDMLNDFLSSSDAERVKSVCRRTRGGISGRRYAQGGIGRPPY